MARRHSQPTRFGFIDSAERVFRQANGVGYHLFREAK